MAKSKRWRKAMIASLVIHAVVLTGVGWIASRSLVHQEVAEQVVELDLSQEADFPLAENGDFSTSAGGSSGAAPQAAQQAVPAAAPAASAVPRVMAATSSMSVLSAQVPTSVSEPSGENNVGQSSGVSGQGQVASGGSGNGNSGSGGSGGGNGSESGGSGSGRGSGNGGSGRGGGYTHPGILSQVTPAYPESARRQGVQGTVILKIQILASGRPGFVSVYRSSGDDSLDDAAVEAVQQWRFIPAEDRSTGEAITCITTMPVVFRLD